jgi:uncharacterized protein YdaU (DUF1376 family)
MMHYYQHHIGDFIKATARLSDSQAMSYLRLLWMYYDSEKPLKPDTKVLAFQIGATVEDTELLLESFFVLFENGWHQTRCDKEIEDYRQFLNKKSNAGKASAERKKNTNTLINEQNSNTCSTDVQQVFNTCSTDVQLTTNHKPQTTIHKPISKVNTPQGVTNETWDSFIAQRKLSKATITQTVINSIQREADKAGWTLEQALAETVTRGWRSFKAEWVKDKPQAQPLKSFRQMDEERSKERYNQMIGRSTSRVIDITPDNFLEITDAAPKSH